MKKWFLWGLLALVFVLTGCAGITPAGIMGAAPGHASYSLKKESDGSCTVQATTGREVGEARVMVGPECTLVVEARGLAGAEAQTQLLGLINALVTGKLQVPEP